MVIKLEKIKALLYENGSAVIRNADIYIKDDRIFKVDTTMQAQDAPKADKIIDGKDRLAIPGLINAHTHAYMTMFRNIADDVPFTTWLFDTIEPLEDAMTPEGTVSWPLIS